MVLEPADRGLVVKISAQPSAALDRPFEGTDDEPERAVLDEAADYDATCREYCVVAGELDAATRRRIARLLTAADEFGTELRLALAPPPPGWRGPVLTRPVYVPGTSWDFQGYVDPHSVSTLLIIDAQYVPGGPAYHWWLSAEPPSGSHPSPAAAVAALRALTDTDDPFQPSSGFSAQQFGGTQRATVRGFWHGRWVQAEFNRTDSGEMHRWDRLRPLLEPDFARDLP